MSGHRDTGREQGTGVGDVLTAPVLGMLTDHQLLPGAGGILTVLALSMLTDPHKLLPCAGSLAEQAIKLALLPCGGI